ncbi:MAG: hypothetical protein ACK4JY_07800 [Brevundimonas sp.]|uniref:helix-turn-helix domain-containing protein n=1 Tax=Brevundimonas sp. TaxID=1871086 RepID=UPI00391BC462
MIGQYRENHPGIEVEITEGTARDAVMQLRADRLDVAVQTVSAQVRELEQALGHALLKPAGRGGSAGAPCVCLWRPATRPDARPLSR